MTSLIMLVINQVFRHPALQGETKLKGDNVPVMVGLGDILPVFENFM